MISTEKYIRSNFSFIFPKQIEIRKMSAKFEEILGQFYLPPQLNGVPDEFPASVPRIIFSSKNNFSKIIISQINVSLEVYYSANYKLEEIKKYNHERIELVQKIIKEITDDINFIGFTTIVRIPTKTKEESIKIILDKYFNDRNYIHYADINCKKTLVKESKYYVNIMINNYKNWKNVTTSEQALRLSDSKAEEFGIEITIDYNDRFEFNENEEYKSSFNQVNKILDGNFLAMNEEIEKINREA